MKKEDLKFDIDQLRKDKILFAIEMVATILAGFLLFLFSNQYFSGTVKDIINTFAVFGALGFTLYLSIKSTKKLIKLKRLEKEFDKM